ncbi:MAG: protein kinase [Gemmataceae bacterium]|nr:protein kinase [Gemmataceae bacterium]
MERHDPPSQQFLTRVNDAFATKVVEAFDATALPNVSPYAFLRPPEDDTELGRLGNYRVLRLLGYGGMGLVFHAEDLTLHRPVALKVVKPNADFATGEASARFLREARAMAAIKHDHIVTVYQVGEEDGNIYVAMELLEGETLESWCERVGRPLPGDIVRVGLEIARGLDAIHRRGLIHRDIKPMNLWMEAPNGRIKILDFGLARAAHENRQLTEVGILIGTPAYLSPEQARGKPVDGRSDLFSLGCVLYRVCTGKLPFPAENTLDQLAALAADEPTPLVDLNPAVPRPLAQLVTDLLSKKPEQRPESAEEVAERLLRLQRSLREPRHIHPDNAARDSAGPDPTERIPVLAGDAALGRRTPHFLARHWRSMLLAPLLLAAAVFAVIGAVSLLDPAGAGEQRVFLSDLKKHRAVNWPFHKTKDGKGMPKELLGPAFVQGRLYPSGIIMHPAPPFDEPASLTFQLNGQYRRFAAQVSLNDSSPHVPSPVTFAVYGDGKLLWRSQELIHQGHAQQCEVAVTDVNELKIEATAAGDVRGSHPVWLDPHVTK